jgi:hypothetical protein
MSSPIKASQRALSKKNESKYVTKLQVQNMLKSVNPIVDMKYVDASLGSYQPTYSYGAISSLVVPVQGTSRNQRIGDVVKYKYLHVRGQFYGAVSHICRMILFTWTPITTPSGSDILDATYINTFRAPFAPYNYEQKQNYHILLDKTHMVSATGAQNDPFDYSLKLKNVARFTTGSSVCSYKIYGLWVQDGIVTLGTYDMVFRAYFEDE